MNSDHGGMSQRQQTSSQFNQLTSFTSQWREHEKPKFTSSYTHETNAKTTRASVPLTPHLLLYSKGLAEVNLVDRRAATRLANGIHHDPLFIRIK
jgi:hypothetical protein